MQWSGYQFMPLLPPPSQFESAAHSRLGGMVCVVLHAPFGGGFPVELIQAARLGPFRRPGGVCHPFAFSERKGRPCQWYG